MSSTDLRWRGRKTRPGIDPNFFLCPLPSTTPAHKSLHYNGSCMCNNVKDRWGLLAAGQPCHNCHLESCKTRYTIVWQFGSSSQPMVKVGSSELRFLFSEWTLLGRSKIPTLILGVRGYAPLETWKLRCEKKPSGQALSGCPFGFFNPSFQGRITHQFVYQLGFLV